VPKASSHRVFAAKASRWRVNAVPLPSELVLGATVQAARTYTAPGASHLDSTREQALRKVAEQIALSSLQERELHINIESSVRERFLALEIAGVQPMVAAGLIAELGVPRPGFGVSRIAVFAGVATVEVSSAGGVEHRLSRGGSRGLNMLLYLIALPHQRAYAPAQLHMARRKLEGLQHVELGVR
jgi:Transposase IS116/IS110/IS902 family